MTRRRLILNRRPLMQHVAVPSHYYLLRVVRERARRRSRRELSLAVLDLADLVEKQQKEIDYLRHLIKGSHADQQAPSR